MRKLFFCFFLRARYNDFNYTARDRVKSARQMQEKKNTIAGANTSVSTKTIQPLTARNNLIANSSKLRHKLLSTDGVVHARDKVTRASCCSTKILICISRERHRIRPNQ